MKTDCPWESEVAAWVTGELPDGQRTECERHLTGCSACRDSANAMRSTVEQLLAVPRATLPRDLTPGIMARISALPDNIVPLGRRWLHKAAAAAAVAALISGAAFYSLRNRPENTEPVPVASSSLTVSQTADAANVNLALDWFCVRQEVDGSWDPAKWGGNKHFRPALTALPLIALLEGSANPEHLAAADRALACLRREQNRDGSFGRGSYNHGICTLALLCALEAKPDAALRECASAAVQLALHRQTASGGWGDSINPEVPVTQWHREALALAVQLGWTEAAPALEKADRWLAAQPSPALPASGSASAEAGYLDCYFAVVRLHRQGTPEAAAHIQAIRQRLMASQSRTGDDSGSWEPTDQWSRAGGRIYSTALASLALH